MPANGLRVISPGPSATPSLPYEPERGRVSDGAAGQERALHPSVTTPLPASPSVLLHTNGGASCT